MTDTTDALELLTEQHDEIDQLISQIEVASGDDKAELFRKVADDLAAHATIEEKLFYPAVVLDETAHLLLEATEEHLAIKRVLADMLELDTDDPRFDAKLVVLKEEWRHHAHDEEEGKLFPLLRDELGDEVLAALGADLLVMYEELIDREPRMNVAAETAEAAHLDVAF